jgi:hypothetical protein
MILDLKATVVNKGAFTLANFSRDFALSLHVLLNKNYLFSLLNVQASAKSRAKSCQCKCTLKTTWKGTVVEHSARHTKVKGSSLAATAGTGKEKTGKYSKGCK